MSVNEVESILLWGIGLNYVVLLIWFGVFVIAHDWLYGFHGRWFRIPVESFDTMHYAGMAAYKIGILLFFLVPYLALALVF